jgi:hypothetical protein
MLSRVKYRRFKGQMELVPPSGFRAGSVTVFLVIDIEPNYVKNELVECSICEAEDVSASHAEKALELPLLNRS